MITFEQIRDNPDIRTYILQADESLQNLGYTEHNFAHVTKVSETAAYILRETGYDTHTVELARIAGYLHDIGNLVNRVDHAQSGAVMAFRILACLGMSAKDTAAVVTAIGNHDEGTGMPVSPISAALILADKSDVRRSRVRNTDIPSFDIHDRVNYSVTESFLEILPAERNGQREIRLNLSVDTGISSVMDYFEIFLARMVLCRKAAEKLDLCFRLFINTHPII